jgi:hypothetical protein
VELNGALLQINQVQIVNRVGDLNPEVVIDESDVGLKMNTLIITLSGENHLLLEAILTIQEKH